MTPPARALVALALLASPALLASGLAADASMRRARSREGDLAVATLAARLPSNDLALSGGSRWLRALSLEEPQAAFADGPATPDPDPAGAAVAPPLEVWLRTEAR